MKIFQMSDVTEWWIGPSLEACRAEYDKLSGDPVDSEDAHELSDADLDRLTFVDDDGETKRTFREQLEREVAAGGEFPRMFASTDF